MVRVWYFVLTAMVASCVGCSKSEPVAEDLPPSQHAGEAKASPAEIVSQFLDRVRRGGEDSGAGALLTEKAQAELSRIEGGALLVAYFDPR